MNGHELHPGLLRSETRHRRQSLSDPTPAEGHAILPQSPASRLMGSRTAAATSTETRS